jgi:23S rRNA pseudouridine1911/1915/1917 synthase
VIREEVPPALADQRLDRIVALLADVSRAEATVLVDSGAVAVDGTIATSGKVRIGLGAVVSIDRAALPTTPLPGPDPEVAFRVVFHDEHVIVVDKPAGLVVHPGAGNPDGTLVNGILARFPDVAGVADPTRPGIVHRLDAGSSGLLVVARTDEAAEELISQFADHTATRRYEALVWGHPAAPHGIIDAPIGRDRRDPLKMAVVADGREARTEYEVTARFDRPAEVARVRCRLETGRTHQIRVHLTSIGHPLVGDTVYGGRRPTLGLTRPFLHAAELAFDHPATGERVTFESPLPADLVGLEATLVPVATD